MALTRRTVLAAGAVGAVGTATGLSLWRQRDLDRAAQQSVTAGPTGREAVITQGTFRSAARGGIDARYFLVVPAGVPLPLRPVIALHGSDGTAELALGLGAADALSRAVATGSPPVAIASIDGGARSFWHRRASGDDSGGMVLDEFLPELQARGLDTSRVGFLGWSMGGYGALLLGGRLGATRTAAICAVSSGLWPDGDYPEGAFDSRQDYLDNTVWGLRALDDIPIRIDCGTGDALYPANRQFAAQLARPPAGGFTAGGHDNDYWSSQLPSEIAWLASYVGSSTGTPPP